MPDVTPPCPDCPFVISIDAPVTRVRPEDVRFVRLRLSSTAEVILTRAQFAEGLRRGKAIKRGEARQRRIPPIE